MLRHEDAERENISSGLFRDFSLTSAEEVREVPECPLWSLRKSVVRFCGSLMLNALRYYWITAKGYRLRPWKSPYIQWRIETFYGKEAANWNAQKFFDLMWRERARMKKFLAWVAARRREQKSKR